jgi:nicotinate phosphoribosyltransferase
MKHLQTTYQTSLTLLTDLYQLTMAYGYWKNGTHNARAVFHQYFRRNPFAGGFSLAAGLADVLDFLGEFRFDRTDIDYLAALEGNDGQPLFEKEFLAELASLRLTCDVDAIPEGTVVFPNEPLLRVTGPIMQCQLLETILLNMVNFQTLIATKAARVCQAAGDDAVMEFGLRRAQGIDGGLAASRAAYVGGCSATSNVLAGKVFGIPVRGTHAHSWVMSFDTELKAFDAYAAVMPNNCVFLVDTYDTLEGVRHAALLGRRLRETGHKMVGIRIDSGDLAYLSIEARKILDEAGLTDAIIVASNDLDETIIQSLKDQGAKISMWGVGTNLVTGGTQPALGGVYKLSAIEAGGQWRYKIKASDTVSKSTIPGILQVRRYQRDGAFSGDAIFDELQPIDSAPTLIDPADITRRKIIPADAQSEDLLVPVVRQGRVVYRSPELTEIRERAKKQLDSLHPAVRRFSNPHAYPVGLESKLWDLRTKMLLDAKNFAN